jgi:hypothetical protein
MPKALWVAIAGAMGVAAAHAIGFAFVCDDAYITFRHVDNALHGHGLVFNPGERTEGFTGLGWALLLLAFGLVGAPLEVVAPALTGLASVGVFALVLLLARRHGVVAMAVAAWLLATHRSLAVWATSGLENRAFTFAVLLAIALVTAKPAEGRRPSYLWGAGGVLAVAAWLRPESLLLGPLVALGAGLAHGGRGPRVAVRDAARVVAPFALSVVVLTAARLAYYGAPLPNTYVAKGQNVWWEGGLAYLAGAAVEYGWGLVLPLVAIGVVTRRVDRLYVLLALAVVPHLVYLVRIGGDHFEYRMLDLAFVAIALGCADAVQAIWDRFGRVAAGVAALVALGSSAVLPTLHARAADGIEERRMYAFHQPIELPEWARVWPFDGWVQAHNVLRAWQAPRMIATRWAEHAGFARHRRDQWCAYRPVRDAVPEGLVTAEGAIGVAGYCLPGVAMIDVFGLTDAVVARMEERGGDLRRLAHPHRDRRTLRPYLDERVNIDPLPSTSTRAAALEAAPYALQLADDVWMPFRTDRLPMLLEGPLADRAVFTGRPVRTPEGVWIAHGADTYALVDVLWDAESPGAGWTARGQAFRTVVRRRASKNQAPIEGAVGRGFVNTFTKQGDRSTGVLTSPVWPVDGEDLALGVLVGGGDTKVGVRVRQPGRAPVVVHGAGDERLRLAVVPPASGEVSVEIFDHSRGRWGHVIADQFVLLRKRPRTTVP